MRNALTVGDEIITIGGIMGVVVNVTEDNITIETGEDKVRIQFKKWAVSSNVRAEAAEAKAKAEEEAKKPVPVPEDIALLREIRDALKKN